MDARELIERVASGADPSTLLEVSGTEFWVRSKWKSPHLPLMGMVSSKLADVLQRISELAGTVPDDMEIMQGPKQIGSWDPRRYLVTVWDPPQRYLCRGGQVKAL